MRNRSRALPETSTVVLYHRDDVRCPDGPKLMMGELHRMGCGRGSACLSAKPSRSGAVRAVFYAKRQEEHGTRVKYLCAPCGAEFAAAVGIALTPASRSTR